MEYFINGEGKMWNTVLEILQKKVQEGVKSGLCMTVPVVFHCSCIIIRKKLEEYGIRCKIFNPIKPALSTVQNNRDHRKIVVIDGKTALPVVLILQTNISENWKGLEPGKILCDYGSGRGGKKLTLSFWKYGT